MCDGQQVHECTDSEQMVALLQSGRAVFGVSVGSLWKQIRETLAHGGIRRSDHHAFHDGWKPTC